MTHFMRKLHTTIGAALTVVLSFVCLSCLGQSTNQSIKVKPVWNPPIRVQFLSLTNDASGAKLASFELHNMGKEAWNVSLPGFVDLGRRGGGYFGFTNCTLKAGASVKTRIPVPQDRNRWRAEFLCSPPKGTVASSIYSEYLQ